MGFLIGALVAALGKSGSDGAPQVTIMLQELIHRGHQSHEIITPEAALTVRSLDELPKYADTSAAAVGHDIDLRLPFIDGKLMRFALNLPTDLKIESADDPLRKRVLRQLAKDLDTPVGIADRPKKAIQLETGVDKALRDLAKSKGLTP